MTGGGNYSSGDTATVTAAPYQGYSFTGWSGACSGTGSCSVTMNSNKSVTASFSFVPPTKSPVVVPPTSSLIATFQGLGSSTTLPFTVSSSPWILELPSSGSPSVGIYNARTGAFSGTRIDNKVGEYLVYGHTGELYLDVRASKAWTLKVKEANTQSNIVGGGNVVTFQGLGSSTTLPFTVSSSPWILELPSSGSPSVGIYNARTGAFSGTRIDNKVGEYLVYGHTGELYLDVRASKAWTLKVKNP